MYNPLTPSIWHTPTQCSSTTHRRVLAAALTVSLIAVGCGGRNYDGPQRVALSGSVTLDGQPVDGGTISFLPNQGDGRVTGGQIVSGSYEVLEAKGAIPGSYQVRVNWLKPTGKKLKDSDTGALVDEVAEAIPKRFHQDSTLTVTVDGKGSQPQVFDFNLSTK